MVIMYEGEPISVPKEVADFLEQDRKREQAEAKRDKRHLSKGDLETVLSPKSYCLYSLDDLAIRNLRLENLRKAVAGLDKTKQELIQLRYGEGLSLEKIGVIRGVSKMAISKQLKKVHKELRGFRLVTGSLFFLLLKNISIFWFTNCLRVSFIMWD